MSLYTSSQGSPARNGETLSLSLFSCPACLSSGVSIPASRLQRRRPPPHSDTGTRTAVLCSLAHQAEKKGGTILADENFVVFVCVQPSSSTVNTTKPKLSRSTRVLPTPRSPRSSVSSGANSPDEVKNSWKRLAEEEKARHQRQYPD